ncbi:porin [Thalassotalea ponticola]|uniref:porin n=1 Tax=Thalassotalea ponticola TaxID=1523392 RepID=UPI0025B58065|nr:porin [Thalassotalea ponticola]MDN3651775.1 porin [Thalassotalea ponticola]
MNLTKTTIAVSLLAAMSAPAMASNDINFYGKANVGLQSSDEGGEKTTEVKSNASRLGVNGELAVNDNLSVVYKAEMQLEMADDSADNIKARNQYVGLKGDFGTVLLGRNDTMLKQSQGKIDLFSDYEGDIKNLWKGENRMGETLTYTTPKFGDFYAGITYVAEGDKDQISKNNGDDGFSAALMYGDAKLKKSQFFASIAIDSDIEGYDNMRASAQTKFGALTLGLIVHNQEEVESGNETSGVMVSAAYKINDFTLKGQVQSAEEDFGDDVEYMAYSVGVDYALAKNAKLFAWATSIDNDKSLTGEEDSTFLSTGIEYKF